MKMSDVPTTKLMEILIATEIGAGKDSVSARIIRKHLNSRTIPGDDMNSCNKGKAGERDAAAYLRSIGFASARRTQQHCGTAGDADVICDELPNLHLEIKRVQGMDVGTQLLADAVDQAANDAIGTGRRPIVMWRPNGKKWRATISRDGFAWTASATHELLAWLNRDD